MALVRRKDVRYEYGAGVYKYSRLSSSCLHYSEESHDLTLQYRRSELSYDDSTTTYLSCPRDLLVRKRRDSRQRILQQQALFTMSV